MTPEKINEAVARKLGWTQHKLTWNWFDPSGKAKNPRGDLEVPDYCHSIAAAWTILSKLSSDGFSVAVDIPDKEEVKLYVDSRRQWHCNISGIKGKRFSDADADTAPRAICLAFLKLP